MSVLLVRPYPVHRLVEARTALDAAAHGDLAHLHRLYRAAADALATIDPDEVEDFRADHARAFRDDQALARAAVAVADTWEGVVAIGSMLSGRRFRGFAWLCAQIRYDLEPARRDASRLRAYESGEGLPGTSTADAALYVALPALMGLGPELPDEVAPPCAVTGEPVARILGLAADADWAGIDPLDAIAIAPDVCRAQFAVASADWRPLLGRGLATGLVVRTGDRMEG
jgi:hypothetical protein